MWKLSHIFQQWFGMGPRFILAEPGTNPMDEPELYEKRQRGLAGTYIALAVCVVLLGVLIFFGLKHYGYV